MNRRSPVLEKLAELYAASTLGSTGTRRDFIERFEDLIAKAKCERGDAYANAIADLEEGECVGAVELDRHRRSGDVQKVRVPIEREGALFARVGRVSPTAERAAWSGLFEEALKWEVPERFAESWAAFCRQRAEQARAGKGWKPFRRGHRLHAEVCMEIVAKLLAWNHRALLRTASVQITGKSKFFERSRGTLLTLLAQASGGAVMSFENLGISDNPRKVCFHGPVRIRLGGVWTDYGGLGGESALSEDDLARAEAIEYGGARCVTVENATKFHELCRLGCGDVFVFTSYPNRATVEFLRRVPGEMPLYHFGDTDPWGFDVLLALRQALGRKVLPLHMRYRERAGSAKLGVRDVKKLEQLLAKEELVDVREELERMRVAGRKGDFEQEGVLVAGEFPYVAGRTRVDGVSIEANDAR